MKPVSWTKLSDPIERATARLAAIARQDTIHGGAMAMVIAKDGWFEGEYMRKDKFPVGFDANSIVSDVYSASTGERHPVHEAWECSECGQAHLGINAAMECCKEPDQELSDGDPSEYGDN